MFKRNRPRRRLTHNDTDKKSNVFSYHSTPRTTESSTTNNRVSSVRTSQTKGRYDWRQLPSIFAAITILISIGYLLTLSSTPRIQALNSETGQYLIRKPEAYQEKAEQLLNSSISNKLKLTVNTQLIESALKAEFPELRSVSVILPFIGRQPVIKLTAASPSLVLLSQNGAYIVNSSGVITMPASEAGDLSALSLPEVKDESSIEVKAGNGVLTSAETSFITTLNQQLKEQKLQIESITLPPIPSEVRVRLKGFPYYVRFNMQLDPKQSAGTYLAVKKHLENSKQLPPNYIDVRVEGRAYYK